MSIPSSDTAANTDVGARRAHLARALESAAHYLPAQGPIGVFVHHNTLHAFQHLPFHDAVASAMDVLDVDGYQTEDAFEAHVRTGRIDPSDIDFALASHRDSHAHDDLFDPRVEEIIVKHRIVVADREAVLFRVAEHGWGSLVRADLSEGARHEACRRAKDEVRASVARLGVSLSPRELADLLAPSWVAPEGAPKGPRGPRAALLALGVASDNVDACIALTLRGGASADDRVAREVDHLRAVLRALGAERATLDGLRKKVEESPEDFAASTLLAACANVPRSGPIEPPHADLFPRLWRDRTPRDLLLALTGNDPAQPVDRVLIRLLGAYLDEGLARRPMPDRDRGLWATFTEFMLDKGRIAPAWQDGLKARLTRSLGLEPADVVLAALDELGIQEEHWETFLRRVLLTLPGWSGMVSRLERMPLDRPPGGPPASLLAFTAVRLCLDLVSWEHAARETLGHRGSLLELEHAARAHLPPAPADDGNICHEDAWGLFHVSKLLGISATTLRTMEATQRERVLSTLRRTRGLVRRRILHEAFERHYYAPVLDALVANRARGLSDLTAPRAQVVCCIDDREESFVRAIEENAPGLDVRNTAGFFGVPVYFRGLDDPSFAPQCPAPVTPTNEVVEAPRAAGRASAERRVRRRTLSGWLEVGLFRASRQLALGLLLVPALGLLAPLAMLVRILRPRWAAHASALARRSLLAKPKTELLTSGTGVVGETGKSVGFTLAEKVTRVAAALENINLVSGFADLIVLLGHGSSSMNNPHESAHDCGACGGRHGGPNARLFAHLANDPEVRQKLRTRGIDIPDATVFVGGQHDTANDDVHLYDDDLAKEKQPARLAEIWALFEKARRLSAHERCRRFEAAPRDPTPDEALRHVEGRSEDLSQVRPEYGHCTKATAIIGRRVLSRGVFLDRRALLVSYDPAIDPEGKILERILAAVGPVGAGINLEYYFSSVDPDRLGCGTKLPHNITGYLGVMEGAESDLRTGLPRQMTEVHEAVRLLLICEATPETLLGICERQPEVRELVVNDWVELVSLDPATGALQRYANGVFVPHAPTGDAIETVPRSRDWYRGQTGYLPPALIARSTRSMVPPPPDGRKNARGRRAGHEALDA